MPCPKGSKNKPNPELEDLKLELGILKAAVKQFIAEEKERKEQIDKVIQMLGGAVLALNGNGSKK